VRLPRFVLACVFLVSSTLFGQHSSSSSSGGHSSSSGSSHSSSSSSHSSSASHTSQSTHTSSSTPTASSPKTEAPMSEAPKTEAPKSDAAKTEVHERETKADPKPVVEEASAEKRVLPPEPEKEKEPAPKETPDLRWRVLCGDKPCQTMRPTQPPDLRHHICLTGPCNCPAGQVAKNGGCVAQNSNPVSSLDHNCAAGQVWNGANCGLINRACHAGQVWNGTRCQADCSALIGRQEQQVVELRSARQQRDSACTASGAGSPACAQAETHYQMLLTEYTGLYDSSPLECRGSWPPPTSI